MPGSDDPPLINIDGQKRDNYISTAKGSSSSLSLSGIPSGEDHGHVDIEMPDSKGINSPAPEHFVSLRTVPLVELSLEHISYAPATRSAAAATGRGRRKLAGFPRSPATQGGRGQHKTAFPRGPL